MLQPVIPSVKQLAPPTPTSSGGGDVSVSQREAEKKSLFKTPTRIPSYDGKSTLGRSGSITNLSDRARPKQDTPRPDKRCKRAYSLDDRTPRQDGLRLPRQRKSDGVCSITLCRPSVRQTAKMAEKNTPQQSKEKLAGRRVCQMLALNAWRKQKKVTSLLTEEAVGLNEKLSGLKRQAVTLRTLLDDEKERVAESTAEFVKMSQLVRESFEDREALIKQKEDLETLIAGLETKLARTRERCDNFKNAFLDAKYQWVALDAVLVKEHEKLTQLAVERQELLDKIEAYEKEEATKQETIDELRNKTETMEKKLKIQVDLYEATMEENSCVNDQIAGLEMESTGLQDRAKEVTSQHGFLMLKIKALEVQLKEKEEEKIKLNEKLGKKFDEIASLNARISAQTQVLQTTWGDRARGVVSSVARFPFKLLGMMFRARQPGLTA